MATTELIMLIGIPASGKTTYATNLATGGGYIRLSSDEVRREMFGDGGYEREEQREVFARLEDMMLYSLRSGQNVIYDATNMNRKNRMKFLKKVPDGVRKVAVLFVTPIDVAMRRNRTREYTVPDDVYGKMLRNFTPPALYEGFDEIDIKWHDGEFDISPYDDWARLCAMSHDNKHHSATIGQHMLNARDYFGEHFNHGTYHDYLCQVAAQWHDIGKPLVKSFKDKKGNFTQDAKFYQHHNVGSYIFLLIANKYMRHMSDEDLLYISDLIYWHMHPLMSWAESAKAEERDKKLIGEEMYHDIMHIHIADLAAH